MREFKAQGNKAMQSGAFHKAMRMYTKALELDAGNAILYSNRSAAHFNIRQFAESLEDAESAILCDANWWKAYKRKGLALIHMQRYEEAISALEEGLKIVGKNAEMEKNLEFAKACQEQAQNLYILPEPHMMQRLESVPVFIVTDLVGQPFFVTYDDGQQVCTFYFDKQDAIGTLDWIKSENPDLGDSARVIHITLHQAFNLAQETQKQYYEETTRAAAEEDRRMALEAEAQAKAIKDGKKIEEKPEEDAPGHEDDWESAPVTATDSSDNLESKDEDEKEGDSGESAAKESTVSTSEPVKDDSTDKKEEKKDTKTEDGKEEVVKDGVVKIADGSKEGDDAIIDENAPLSFQFRPELRQVQVAVELLNKSPHPRVRPILRDPPSIRKAKAEAAAEDTKGGTSSGKAEGEAQESEEVKNVGEGETVAKEEKVETETKDGTDDGDEKEVEKTEGEVKGEDEKDESVVVAGNEVKEESCSAKGECEGEKVEKEETSESCCVKGVCSISKAGDDDVELTVDNFNGIPIFQAKGLTLLQKSKQLIPLFFSKWDLEAAWEQLKDSNMVDVPGECEIEVGTLEDVLRRMSENKTDELDSVFFVPSRESMKAINVKFPLDELTSPVQGMYRAPAVKKAGFSKAKQIAARGGSKEEIRAAIREDLEKYAERKKMAEVISQIEHARRTGGVGGSGNVGFGSASGVGGGGGGSGE